MFEHIILIIPYVALTASGWCLVAAFQYAKARKKLEQAAASYMTMVEMQSEEMRRQSIASLSGDNIEMCGGCGGYFPKSTIDKCPGKTCENFKNILAERDAT